MTYNGQSKSGKKLLVVNTKKEIVCYIGCSIRSLSLKVEMTGKDNQTVLRMSASFTHHIFSNYKHTNIL